MDTFVNPLRSSMRNVSNAVKSFPDSLGEGMTKFSDNMGRMSERLGQDIKQSIFKVPPLQQFFSTFFFCVSRTHCLTSIRPWAPSWYVFHL